MYWNIVEMTMSGIMLSSTESSLPCNFFNLLFTSYLTMHAFHTGSVHVSFNAFFIKIMGNSFPSPA
jgi:hypothetical protein